MGASRRPPWKPLSHYLASGCVRFEVTCRRAECWHRGTVELASIKADPATPMNLLKWKCTKCDGKQVMIGPELRDGLGAAIPELDPGVKPPDKL
jgi:hypothetical protein